MEWVALVVVSAGALAVAAQAGSTSQLRVIRNLLIAGALMRIVGVFARHTMIFELYDGGSDAVGYFEAGRLIADHFRSLDFSIIGSGQWGNREWGTQAIRYAAGLVLTVVGPSVRGAYLVFSLAAFTGLVCTVVAVARGTNSARSMRQAASMIFFWPTLWFWPSSIGKEAVLLLAVGLVTVGYVGQKERLRWLPLSAGLALAMAIRPHVAGVLAVAICAAEWTRGQWTLARALQSAFVSALALWVVTSSLTLLGLESADVEAMQEFVAYTAGQTNQGGSAFEQGGTAAAAVPMAFVNILCRPFITEANSTVALLSSFEMMLFWLLVFRYGRNLPSLMRSWHSNRLLRFAVPFALLYVLMLGLTFQNFGIIARQRALVMPALLSMLAMAQARQVSPAAARPSRRVWRRAAQPSIASS